MGNVDKRKNLIVNVLYWAIIVALIFILFKYLIPLIMPFAVAFAISFMLRPIIKFFNEKLRMKWNVAAVILVLLFYSTIGVLITLTIIKLVAWLQSVLILLPALYTNMIAPKLMDLFAEIQEKITLLGPTVADTLGGFGSEIISSLGSSLSNLSMKAVGMLSGFAALVPGMLISILITIIATFFMAGDYPNITAFVLRQLPQRSAEMLLKIKTQIVEVIGQFFRSYCLIMLITFVELTIGFFILGVPNPLAFALIIAIFDVMPVLGTGGVLIPWMLASFVMGNVGTGLGLLVIYIVVTVVRNIVEPRIIGHQVGLHPLVTLISMFVGTKLFGLIGLFGLPITCAIIKSLNDKGAIKILK